MSGKTKKARGRAAAVAGSSLVESDLEGEHAWAGVGCGAAYLIAAVLAAAAADRPFGAAPLRVGTSRRADGYYFAWGPSAGREDARLDGFLRAVGKEPVDPGNPNGGGVTVVTGTNTAARGGTLWVAVLHSTRPDSDRAARHLAEIAERVSVL